MPKQVTENELQRIEAVLLRFPAGLSLVRAAERVSASISRRTVSRRISDLLVAGRIIGAARGEQPGIYTARRLQDKNASTFSAKDEPVVPSLLPAPRTGHAT